MFFFQSKSLINIPIRQIQYQFIQLKISTNIQMMRSSSIRKSQASPTKSKHTITHPDKLKVYVKFRPPNPNSQHAVKYLSSRQLQAYRPLSTKTYKFDRVFHQNVNSKVVFECTAQHIIDEVLQNGGNGLLFVYGHTGTGKTHTMGLLDEISINSEGLIPETFKYLQHCGVHNTRMSFTEIYMDEVYDLLDFENPNTKKLQLRQHPDTKQPYIENLTNITVRSVNQAYTLINIGLQNRRIAQQKLNSRSSRSHAMMTVQVEVAGKVGRLCFVDLAGSQRVKQSESSGERFDEAIAINSSLSALETLLTSISQQNVRMYRGNKLTRLLQPYIETGKIKLIVTSNYEHTQSIQFAKRCKGIKFTQRQQKSPTKQPQKYNFKQTTQYKNIMYCVSQLLGVLCKLESNIEQILQDLEVKSIFSLTEQFSIKSTILQNQINNRINKLQEKQTQILNEKYDPPTLDSSQSLIHILNDPAQFTKKIQNMGFCVFKKIKQIFTVTQYRNVYKKQLFITQLKNSLLQQKNKQFEQVINHLLSGKTANQQKKLMRELKNMGVQIVTQKPDKKVKEKMVDSKVQRSRRANIENSPLNHSQKRSIIYIQQA